MRRWAIAAVAVLPATAGLALIALTQKQPVTDAEYRELLRDILVENAGPSPEGDRETERMLMELPAPDRRVLREIASRQHFQTAAEDDDVFRAQIYLGSDDEDNEHADCAAVGSDAEFFCSGVLVGRNVIATAKHCVDDGPLERVFFGQDVASLTSGSVVEVNGEPVLHDDLDLALLVLEQEVTLLRRPLAQPGAATDARSLRVAGFGNSNAAGTTGYGKRRRGSVFSEPCRPGAAAAHGCLPGFELVTPPQMAGVFGEPCTGDSGGPSYLLGAGGWEVTGIMSRSTAAAGMGCGLGAVYVRLDRADVQEWIHGVDGGLF